MGKLTDQQVKKRAVLTRVRTEGTILRTAWLNEVLPLVEDELDRRIAAGESMVVELPEVDEFASAYAQLFIRHNKQLGQ